MALEVLRRYQRPILIGVTVFVLLTFSITGTMMLAFRKGEEKGIASFRLPSGKTCVVDRGTYQDYAYGCELTLGLLPYLRSRLAEPDVFRFLMLHRLAREAGLDVSAESVSEFLQAWPPLGMGLRPRERYDAFLRDVRIRARTYEEFVRRYLVVDRFLAFAVSLWAIPGPADIEGAWKKDHARFTLEVVSFPSDARTEEVSHLLAKDEELDAWRNALPDPEKRRYQRDVRTSFEGAAVSRGDLASPPAGPLADALGAIDVPEADLALLYERTKGARYRRETPPGSETRPETSPATQPTFLPLEEVRDRVLAEARAKKLFERVAAEASAPGHPPFAEIAKKLGLETFAHSSVTQEELQALPRFTDDVARVAIATYPAGKILPGPYFSGESVYMIQIVGREEPGQAAVGEIREKLLADWRQAKAIESAEAAAKAFKEAVEKRTEPDAFSLEALAKGLPPARVGPLTRESSHFPDHAKLPEGAQKFLEERVDL
ncbi:MAG TPA: hypothetical protein VKF62_11405, partial [Planctomycetota bacterium]|nr:hypothetical protein [Planctomycetota bacterium]